MLEMYTIYCKPSDYPTNYVVRKFKVRAGGITPTDYVYLCDNLEDARECIPDNMTQFMRAPDDVPSIVETWV